MSAEDRFKRLLPAFARQASGTDDHANLHAAADQAIAKAEDEFYDLQRELQAALNVPLRHRAIKVTAPADAEPPDAASATRPGARPTLAERLARAAR